MYSQEISYFIVAIRVYIHLSPSNLKYMIAIKLAGFSRYNYISSVVAHKYF